MTRRKFSREFKIKAVKPVTERACRSPRLAGIWILLRACCALDARGGRCTGPGDAAVVHESLEGNAEAAVEPVEPAFLHAA